MSDLVDILRHPRPPGSLRPRGRPVLMPRRATRCLSGGIPWQSLAAADTSSSCRSSCAMPTTRRYGTPAASVKSAALTEQPPSES